MWMDAYVQETLIRQQIAECERAAAMHHALRDLNPPRQRSPWRSGIQRFIRSAAASWRRRSAERVAVR